MALKLLLIDDSPGEVRLTQEAFHEANSDIRLHVVPDGVEAKAFLRREGDFWLTSVKLPRQASSE